MSQNVIVKPTLSQPVFPLNIRGVNEVFPGFALDDFAVLQGSSSVSTLVSLICVKAQLPTQLNGLHSNVVFIDGGNTFNLYQISQLAQIHHLKPKEVLEGIFISRAFTAYQVEALIMDQLKKAIKKHNSKLVIISDIAGFFLDKDIPDFEAQRVFSHVLTFLSNFSREQHVIVIATYPPHTETDRNRLIHTLTCSKANVVLSLRKTSYSRQFVLEKHPYLSLRIAEVALNDFTLADFAEGNA
jgi:hypothetical protein